MIPEKVKVSGTVYDIIRTQKAIVGGGHAILDGRIIYTANLIELYDGTVDDLPVKEQNVECTLWHEIIHAICTDRKIEFGENVKEEDIVNQLAHGLYALMKDNPFPLPGQEAL